ncbi:helix-turn-helix domain-containing protein [Haloechinothrix sp. YIM 98757]|uniref:Helix-turn-helix domain-containing protein n=1 Tax=Haloechinothrix aidingensis TaxID=2752311 RepID=A0A838A326_9PSEU|nr:helix-turn-helix domain-containing protein [Haloechinothrix aidingensis]
MSAIPVADDVLGTDVAVITLEEAANRLGVSVNKVRQTVRDGHLIALRRSGTLCVPEEFIAEDALVKGLAGTLTVLADAGFEPTEMLTWLFTSDESLPGRTPINALRSNQGTEVKRRAQASAL